MFPRWSGLHHFSNIMSMQFSDGSKFEDLSKVNTSSSPLMWLLIRYVQISIFVLHNLFEERTAGYLLLKLLRCYIEIDTYASFQVHTESTIADGQEQVSRFYKLLKVGFFFLS
jgi:hypothetical protein